METWYLFLSDEILDVLQVPRLVRLHSDEMEVGFFYFQSSNV